MKIILIGTTGVGKTTLIQAIKDQKLEWQKTQMITYQDEFIDVPGEYLDIPRLHRAIIVTAMDADLVFLVESATSEEQNIPPGFASIFNQPVIGIVTKIDLAEANIEKTKKSLRLAGANREIISLSAVAGEGINKLVELLKLYGWEK